MTAICLPESPKGKEFEEYVSSFFQCAGYYVEKNITEENILELDIIVTDYSGSVPIDCLVEVKSGKWGFHDVFKVKGWMAYLNINFGYFIVQGGIEESHKHKASELNISLIHVNTVNDVNVELCQKLSCKEFSSNELGAWRFSYWVERIFLDKLIKKKKSTPAAKRYSAMLEYYYTINDDIFFSHCIVDKVEALYGTYHKYPNLSAKVANEVLGNNFEEPYTQIPKQLFNKAFYSCEETDLDLSCFVEYKSRLAIMKTAIDYIMFSKSGVKSKFVKAFGVNIGDHKIEFDLYETLPSTFKEAISVLSTHDYLNKYPIFWQYFTGLMGGFILNDYYEQEINFLSGKTGIPVADIGKAFDVFDILFPTPGGWFKNLGPNSQITILINFPIALRGQGANWRRYLHSAQESIDDFNLTGSYTKNDLTKWINAGYAVLNKAANH